jgi:hypothetical protein
MRSTRPTTLSMTSLTSSDLIAHASRAAKGDVAPTQANLIEVQMDSQPAAQPSASVPSCPSSECYGHDRHTALSTTDEIRRRAVLQVPKRLASVSSGSRHERSEAFANHSHLRRPVRSSTTRIANDPANLCRIEQMATRTAGVSPLRSAILGILLEAALGDKHCDHPVLQPLWANEAMQRAYSMVRLVAALERGVPPQGCHPLALAAEVRLAQELAASFRPIVVAGGETSVPCSQGLGAVVRNLIELFGPAIGRIQVRTSIEPIKLPAFRQRALILAASELVINALCHAFAFRRHGHIIVSLHHMGTTEARLCVVDDGRGMPQCRSQPCGIAFDLASLLGSDLIYRPGEGVGTRAEVTFPILL